MAISSLNRKLLRDLLAMRGQAVAIALVMAAGVAMFVAYLSNFTSLWGTREAYYERQRFADVFAVTKRAPDRLRQQILAIAGVEDVETRVVAEVVLDIPGVDEPASGRLISVPAEHRPRLNDLRLQRGHWVSAARPDEVVASEAFVLANQFDLGDRVSAVINGRRRDLTIVGTALSPEYVYTMRPGELVPDDRRYGILWMEATALASAFDMHGGFNDVSLALSRGAQPAGVMADLDRLLAPFGGRGSFDRAHQFSNWTLENELRQLQTFGFMVPCIFLFVAAFVLNIALTRALALQRPQLAALKALGYTNRELAWHYLKWALVIALGGAFAGVGAGAWLGVKMLQLYNQYFKFPELTFGIAPRILVGAFAIAMLAALLGAVTAVRRSVRISPAEAMRPEAPARFRPSLIETRTLRRYFSTSFRMVLRNLERQPVRALTTVVGISFAVAILQVGFGMLDAMEHLIVTQFSVAERQDLTVSFVEPLSPDARLAVARLPGVLAVEPQRAVPIRLRSGPRQRSLAIIGVLDGARLIRPVDEARRVVATVPDALVISSILGRVLEVRPGDSVTVEMLEGRQLTRVMRIAAFVDDTFGIQAYTDMDTLHRLMRENDTLSGAALLIDRARERDLSLALKRLPAVASVASKRIVVENFRKTLAENMGVMLSFNLIFAGIIAFGVVYNAARVSLSERSRELASLRVLGFTRAEISLILLGELAVLTVVALPLGVALGYGLSALLIQSVESEVYRFPLVVSTQVMSMAALTVVVASILSGLVVRRRLDRLDLVGVLKLRE